MSETSHNPAPPQAPQSTEIDPNDFMSEDRLRLITGNSVQIYEEHKAAGVSNQEADDRTHGEIAVVAREILLPEALAQIAREGADKIHTLTEATVDEAANRSKGIGLELTEISSLTTTIGNTLGQAQAALATIEGVARGQADPERLPGAIGTLQGVGMDYRRAHDTAVPTHRDAAHSQSRIMYGELEMAGDVIKSQVRYFQEDADTVRAKPGITVGNREYVDAVVARGEQPVAVHRAERQTEADKSENEIQDSKTLVTEVTAEAATLAGHVSNLAERMSDLPHPYNMEAAIEAVIGSARMLQESGLSVGHVVEQALVDLRGRIQTAEGAVNKSKSAENAAATSLKNIQDKLDRFTQQ